MFQKSFAIIPMLFLIEMTACAQNGPSVWVSPSLNRVGLTDPPQANTTATIFAARNEYESFQIVVNASRGPLSNVSVSVSSLSGPGQQIPASNIALFRENYTYVNKASVNWGGSNQSLGVGWYPDGLIPSIDPETGRPPQGGSLVAFPFTVAAGQNQPIWVDVQVPASAAPGSYNGTYTVTSSQGSFQGAIALTVWNFTLPQTPSMKSSFGYWTAGTLAGNKELLRNKIAPLNVNPSDEPYLMSNFGLGQTNLRFWSGGNNSNCAMSSAPSVASLKAAVAQHQSGLLLFDFSVDEIGHCANLYPTIQQWGYNLHQAGVKQFVTMTPVPALYDDGSGTGRSAVDVWTLLPVMYDANPSAVQYVLQKGDTAWSTNAVVQDGYSPKWMIDFAPINERIQPGFINQSLGLTGLMYWQVDYWNPNPWYNVNNTGQLSSNNYPGEGLMVYPGADVGIQGSAPSMRLKWIRDGVDDFEYIQMLKQQGQGTWAMSIANSIGPNWSAWNQDPNALEAARKLLGQKLDSLSGGGSGAATPVSIVPASGGGRDQRFNLAYSDANGSSALKSVTALFGVNPSGANACSISYNPVSNIVSLASDSGSTWSSATLGSSSQLQNSQCLLWVAGSWATRAGNNLTVSIPITFAQTFQQTVTLYGTATDASGLQSNIIALGSWQP